MSSFKKQEADISEEPEFESVTEDVEEVKKYPPIDEDQKEESRMKRKEEEAAQLVSDSSITNNDEPDV